MNCSCSCDYGSMEYPEFISETWPRARKAYKCCECGETIKVGEKHQSITGKWDGEILTYRTCEICAKIRDDFCRCAPFTYLREEFMNCYDFDYLELEDAL